MVMQHIGLVALGVDGVLRDASRLFYECHARSLKLVNLDIEFSRCFGIKDIWHFKGMAKFNNKRDSLSTIYSIAKSGRLAEVCSMIYEADAESRISEIMESCTERPSHDELGMMVNEYVRTATSAEAHRLVRVYPHAARSINKIRDSMVKMAIVSNSDILTIERDLKHLMPEFDHVVSSRDVSALKPSGEGLRLVSKMSGVDTSDMIYVGDTVVDIRAAKDAGCASAVVLSGMGLESHLRNEKPDMVFEDLVKAAEWMEKSLLEHV